MFKWLFILCTVVTAGTIKGLPKCKRWAWAYINDNIKSALSKLDQKSKDISKAKLTSPKKDKVFLLRMDNDPATYIARILDSSFQWCNVSGAACDQAESRKSLNEGIVDSYPKPDPSFRRGAVSSAQDDSDNPIINSLKSQGMETDYFYRFGFIPKSREELIKEMGIGIEDTGQANFSLIESMILANPQKMTLENLLSELNTRADRHSITGADRSVWFYNGRTLTKYELAQDDSQKLKLEQKESFEVWAKETFNVNVPNDYKQNHTFLAFGPLLSMTLAQKIDTLYDFFVKNKGTKEPLSGLCLAKKVTETILDPATHYEQVWISKNGTTRFCRHNGDAYSSFNEKQLEPFKPINYYEQILKFVEKDIGDKIPKLFAPKLKTIFACKKDGIVPLTLSSTGYLYRLDSKQSGIVLPFEFDKFEGNLVSFKVSNKFDVPQTTVDRSIFLPIPFTSPDTLQDMQAYVEFILSDKAPARKPRDGDEFIMEPKKDPDFSTALLVKYYNGKYICIAKQDSGIQFVPIIELLNVQNYVSEYFSKMITTDSAVQKFEFTCNGAKVDIQKEDGVGLCNLIISFITFNKLDQAKLPEHYKAPCAKVSKSGSVFYKIKSIKTETNSLTHKITHTVELEKVSS